VFGGRGGLGGDRGGDPVVLGDILYGGPGDDLFDGGADDRAPEQRPDEISYDTATQAVHVDLTALTGSGQGKDTLTAQTWRLTGSPHADTLAGSDLDDEIFGGLGNDTLLGRAGDDRLRPDPRSGHPDDDLVHGGDGNDVIQAYAGADHLFGDTGHDGVFDTGTTGADRLFGGPDDDSLDDVLVDAAHQRLTGGPGDDLVNLDTHIRRNGTTVRTHGTVDLQKGTATMRWSTHRRDFPLTSAESLYLPLGAWTAYGTAGSNDLEARVGPAKLYGRDGDDTLWGTNGNDYLAGGAGTDKAFPLDGRDTCVSIETVDAQDSCEVTR
jgi:Ca2+-binding RTX toxin-like protein